MRAVDFGADADLAWGACSYTEETGREVTTERPASSEELTSSSSLALSTLPKQTTGHSSSTGSVASGLFCALYEFCRTAVEMATTQLWEVAAVVDQVSMVVMEALAAAVACSSMCPGHRTAALRC